MLKILGATFQIYSHWRPSSRDLKVGCGAYPHLSLISAPDVELQANPRTHTGTWTCAQTYLRKIQQQCTFFQQSFDGASRLYL